MAAIPMRRTDFRAIVEPILNEEFDGIYEQRVDEWRGPFREQTGIPRNYHEEPVLYGFGAAPELPDGSPVTYQAGGALFMKRYQYRVWGLAFALTQVLVEDGDHIRIGQIYARHLAQSLIETTETNCANILNRAFNGSYVGGDGVALNVSNHPIVDRHLLQRPLDRGCPLADLARADAGPGPPGGRQQRQAHPPDAARRHLRTLERVPGRDHPEVGTAHRNGNNDVNPINTMGLLREGQYNMSRLTSNTAWWVNTDAPEGLKLMIRRGLKRSMEGDFETDTMRFKATKREIPGWTDRGRVGSPGTSHAWPLMQP